MKFLHPVINSRDMETEDRMEDEGRKETPKGTGRPPPIIVTTNINLIKVQNEIKTKLKGDFALRNTRNGFRISTKSMEDYLILRKHLDQNQTHYYTFHQKTEKPIKAVIRHLPGETPAEDITNKLLALGYKLHNVRQMTTTRQQSGAGPNTSLSHWRGTKNRSKFLSSHT
jgi:hypothetical protein